MHALSEYAHRSELPIFFFHTLALTLLNNEELFADVALMENKVAFLVLLSAQSIYQAHFLGHFKIPKEVYLVQVV